MNWYEIKNINAIDSPALVIYKERIAENLRLLKNIVHNENAYLRPHVKTNKIAEVCLMMLNAGITKFKCATIAEAEMLAIIKAPDVLLSYQPVGPKAKRFLQLIKKYPATHFSCLIDNSKTAEELSNIFHAEKLTVNVFIDINSGMNRTGIEPLDAFILFEFTNMLPALKVIGLHAYDGHIRDTEFSLRESHTNKAFVNVISLAEAIENVSNRKMIIVAGGSPTFPVHAQRKKVECSPGTFIFWDWGYKQILPDEPFEFAALVITRIISIVDETTITTDLGHKSVAAENPFPRVHFLNAGEIIPVSQSEEHMVAKVDDSSKYKIGDVLYGVPIHICPTVALYEKAVVIENNRAVDEWMVIARNRKITI